MFSIEIDYRNALCIGDVHGNSHGFNKAIDYANRNGLFVISLGDLIDYGDDNAEIIDIFHNLMIANKAIMVMGNHEYKLRKYFIQQKENNIRVKVSSAMEKSIVSINEYGNIEQFLEMTENLPNIIKMGNNYFVHGAIHNSFWNDMNPKKCLNDSLFGEVDHSVKRYDGYPNRVYNWVRYVPADMRVFAGHDIRDDEYPYIDKNVYFMDTGSSKGGSLHGYDFSKNKIRKF